MKLCERMQTGLRSTGVQVQKPDIQKLAIKYLLLESLCFSSKKNNNQNLAFESCITNFLRQVSYHEANICVYKTVFSPYVEKYHFIIAKHFF